jgi:hypothetical protein
MKDFIPFITMAYAACARMHKHVDKAKLAHAWMSLWTHNRDMLVLAENWLFSEAAPHVFAFDIFALLFTSQVQTLRVIKPRLQNYQNCQNSEMLYIQVPTSRCDPALAPTCWRLGKPGPHLLVDTHHQ